MGIEVGMQCMQGLIVAVRRARKERDIAPSRTLVAHALIEGWEIVANVAQATGQSLSAQLITLVQTRIEKSTSRSAPKPKNSMLVSGGGLSIYLLDVIDPVKEHMRLSREGEKLRSQIAGIEKKLGNEGFVAKAPPAVIEKERAALAALQAQLAGVEQSLRDLA